MKELKEKDNLYGKTFGKWEVIGTCKISKTRDREWLCKCSCGLVKYVKAQYLKNGSSTKCVSCSFQKTPYPIGVPLPMWNHILVSARKRKLEVSITREFCYDLLVKQKFMCALSGIDIVLPKNGTELTKGFCTASLDRIDSSKGYVQNNVQWIHKDINRMKNIFKEDYFIDICYKIVKYKNLIC